MSLKPQEIEPIPKETVRIVSGAFPDGNTMMKMRDELGVFFEDEQFSHLFSSQGQPALAPWRLALVTIMQYAENLTDRQAADAVRSHMDWKYALGLELDDPGFNFSVLSEFRSRLLAGTSEKLLLDKMLNQFKEMGLLKAKGKQRTDATHVFAAIRTLNRLELVAETMIHTLNVLATAAPDWLKSWVPDEWFTRYEKRLDEYRLPQEKNQRTTFAEVIGADGHYLLSMVYSQSSPEWLRDVPAVMTMREIWIQQYYVEDGNVCWRIKGNLPSSAQMISSPHDTDARYSSKKHTTSWVGYKIHLTETCDTESPNLITDVQTTVATDQDNSVTPEIHKELRKREILPKEHLGDTAYGSTDLVLDSQKEYGIELICPMRPDNSWQARTEGAYDIPCFNIDWERQQVICPEGKTNRYWQKGERDGSSKISVQFHPDDCQSCPSRSKCTRSKGTRGRPGSRELTLSPQKEYETLHRLRQFQKTKAFKERYSKRAGIEGTISYAAYTLGARRCRYRGIEKVHLQHVLTACAINLTRAVNWLSGKKRAQTRKLPFPALAA